MADENLPTLSDTFPAQPALSDHNEEDVLRHDIMLVSFLFTGCARAWSQASDIDSICKAAALTFKTMEKRRDVLGMPNGYRPERLAKGMLVYPLD